MAGALAWTLVGIGVIFLGLSLAFATLRWSRWRKQESPEEARHIEQKTREAFKSEGPD